MSECIYSQINQEKCERYANSEEHVLPRALGNFKDYPSLSEKLCSKCNNDLGKLDEILVRSNPVVNLRATHGVQGRSTHRKTNPFYERSHGFPPTSVYGQAEGDTPFRLEVLENNCAQPLRVLKVGGEEIPVPEQASKSPELLKEFVQSHSEGRSNPSDPEMTFSEFDSDFREVLQKAYSGNLREISIKPDPFLKDYPVVGTSSSEISQKAYRALAKIGFHFFLWAYPDRFSGFEGYFEEIKQYIWNGSESFKPVTFRPASPIVPSEPTLWLFQPSYVHILVAGFDQGSFFASVRLFSGSTSEMTYHLKTDQGDMIACSSIEWRIKIGESSLEIPLISKRVGFIGNQSLKSGFEGKMVRL